MSDDFTIGPVIGIDKENLKQDIINQLVNSSIIPIAVTYDKENEAFKFYKEKRPNDNPIAVIITMDYNYNFC